MKRMIGLVVLMLALTTQVFAQDGIDLSKAVFAGVNPSAWPATVQVTGVEFAPGDTKGVKLVFNRAQANARFPDVVVWPPAGYIQWTLGACVPLDGQWHCGGMHEFWSDRNGPPREWSGAHPLELNADGSKNNWQGNWAYDGRWGKMNQWVPREGAEIAFYMIAGALRPGSSNHPTVQERSNVVVVKLQRQGFVSAEAPIYQPPQPSTPTPTPPADSLEPRLASAEERLQALQDLVDSMAKGLKSAQAEFAVRLTAVEQDIEVLRARRWPVSCRSSIFGIPLSCQLE